MQTPHRGEPCSNVLGKKRRVSGTVRFKIKQVDCVLRLCYRSLLELSAATNRGLQDAVRDSNASAAYYEFLEGLQQINQQEYLQDQHCGLLYKVGAFLGRYQPSLRLVVRCPVLTYGISLPGQSAERAVQNQICLGDERPGASSRPHVASTCTTLLMTKATIRTHPLDRRSSRKITSRECA